jgi:hypothetical protein
MNYKITEIYIQGGLKTEADVLSRTVVFCSALRTWTLCGSVSVLLAVL